MLGRGQPKNWAWIDLCSKVLFRQSSASMILNDKNMDNQISVFNDFGHHQIH